MNYGTNADHARNTLNNCGVRIDKHWKRDRTIKQIWNGRKRGRNISVLSF